MNYATKQLTEELQKLNEDSKKFGKSLSYNHSNEFSLENIEFSSAVENFIEKRRKYSEKTRSISVGHY